jgi:glucan phosphoethanolaminetransferase (alkaline phosphatase superfamily)
VVLVKQQFNTGIFGLLANTNFREARELIGWFIVPILLSVVLFFFIAFFLLKKLPGKVNLSVAAGCFFAGAIVILLFGVKNKRHYEKFSDALNDGFASYFPSKVVVDIANYYRQNVMYSDENYLKITKSFSFGAVKQNQKRPERKIQILVIGESARYDNWQINGYNRNTSPHLNEEKNLVAFSNVVSGSSVTTKSVPLLVSRCGVENYLTHYKEKGVLAAFREAGYYTAWISNQEPESKLAMYHIQDADTIIFSKNQKGKFTAENFYDDLLISDMKRIIEKTNGDVCIVLHTMGNHWNYSCRYPPSFEQFPTGLNKNTFLPNYVSSKDLVNAYDNSILYTDYFLFKVIEELKLSDSTESSLLYISDHGENLYDSNNLLLHTDVPNYYLNKVPMFIWVSNDFIKNNEDYYSALVNNRNKPVSSAESVFYTLLGLGGVNIPSDPHREKYDLCSRKFAESQQKILTAINTVIFFSELKTEK